MEDLWLFFKYIQSRRQSLVTFFLVTDSLLWFRHCYQMVI